MAQIRRQITILIRRYVAALEGRGIPVERVILFGSHAPGHLMSGATSTSP
jgi:predicted nucleotidyltransferase